MGKASDISQIIKRVAQTTVQIAQGAVTLTQSRKGQIQAKIKKTQENYKKAQENYKKATNGIGVVDIFGRDSAKEKMDKYEKEINSYNDEITFIDKLYADLIGSKNRETARKIKNGTGDELDAYAYPYAKENAAKKIEGIIDTISEKEKSNETYLNYINAHKGQYISDNYLMHARKNAESLWTYYDILYEYEDLFGEDKEFKKLVSDARGQFKDYVSMLEQTEENMKKIGSESLFNAMKATQGKTSYKDYGDYYNKEMFKYINEDKGETEEKPDFVFEGKNETEEKPDFVFEGKNQLQNPFLEKLPSFNSSEGNKTPQDEREKTAAFLRDMMMQQEDFKNITNSEWKQYGFARVTGIDTPVKYFALSGLNAYSDHKQIAEKIQDLNKQIRRAKKEEVPLLVEQRDFLKKVIPTGDGLSIMDDPEYSENILPIVNRYRPYLTSPNFEKKSKPIKEKAQEDNDYGRVYNSYIESKNPASRGDSRWEVISGNMNDEEKAMYYYIANTIGYEEASEYIDAMMPIFAARRNQEIQNWGKANPIKALVANVVTSPGKGLIAAYDFASNIFGGGSEYDSASLGLDAMEAMSSGAMSNYGKTGRLIYGGTQIIGELAADMYVSNKIGGAFAPLTGAKVAGKISSVINGGLQASKVANSTYSKYIKEGASEKEALGMGFLNATIEYLAERYTFDKFLKSPSIVLGADKNVIAKSFAKKLGVDFVKEGGEEVVTNWLTSLAAFVTDNNEHDELLSAWDKYKEEGQSSGEAFLSAVSDIAPEYAEEFIVGGFAGAIFEGFNTNSKLKAADEVRADAGDFLMNSGLSRESVETYLVYNGMVDTEEIAKYTNAIIDMASGKTIDKNLRYEIEESPLFRGLTEAYADVTLEEAQRLNVEKKAAETVPTTTTESQPTASDRLNGLTSDISNAKAESIINDAELRTEFENIAGVKIEGTKSEQRAIVKEYASKVYEATKKESAPSEIAEGDVFYFPEENRTYKVISKGEKSTTFEVTSESGTVTKKMSNNLLTSHFTDDKRVIETALPTETNVVNTGEVSDIGRIGANIYGEYAGQNGKLVSDMVREGMSVLDAVEKTNDIFSFMYNQGKMNADMNVAINAASEVFGVKYKSDYELFYTAGKFDADRVLKGKKGAGIVQNNVIKNLRKTDTEFSGKAYRAIEAIAKKSGFDIEFVNEIDGGGNASFDTSTGKFLVSAKSSNPFLTAVVHDAIHAGRSVDTKSYNELQNIVVEILGKDTNVLGKAFSNRLSVYKKEATGKDGKINSDLITEEMVAEVVSHVVSGDTAFIESLAKEDRSFVKRIFDAVKDFFEKALKRYTGEKETNLSPEIRDAVDMLKSEQARVIKAFENILHKTEIMQERKVKTAEKGEVMKSISNTFASEISVWVKEGMPKNETFILGSTGDVLQGLGAIESDIYMLGDKISEILKKHPEITIKEIKKIPQILENPILILKSKNVGRKSSNNTRLIIFGDEKAQDVRPILSILDLKPIENNFIVSDMQKVSSAYIKDTDPIDFVRNSLVVYADKKRTTKLFRTIGFSAPIELQLSGFVGSITYAGQNVNINGKKFKDVFKEINNSSILKSKPETDTETTSTEVAKASVTVLPSLKISKETQAKLDEYVKKFGEAKKASLESVPKKVSDNVAVRRHAATEIESEVISKEGAQTLADLIVSGDKSVTYRPVSNESLLRRAQANIDAVGYEDAVTRWLYWANSDKRISPVNIAEADLLIMEAQRRGDSDNYVKLITTLPMVGTNTAQIMQALSIIKRLPGVEAAKTIDNVISQMQLAKNRIEGKKAERIYIDESLKEDYIKAKDKEAKEATDNINSKKKKVTDKLKKQLPGLTQEELDNMVEDAWNDTVRVLSVQGEPNFDDVLRAKQKTTVPKETVEKLQEEFDKASDALDEELERLSESNSEVKDLKKRLKSLKGRTETAQRRYAEAENFLSEAEDTLLEAEYVYDEAMKEYNEARNKKKEVTETKRVAKLAREKADRAKARVKDAEANIEKYRAEAEASYAEYFEALKTIDRAKAFKKMAEAQKRKTESMVKRAEKWAEKLKVAQEEYATAKVNYKTALENYEARKEKAEAIKKVTKSGLKESELQMVALKKALEKIQDAVTLKFGTDEDGNPKVKIDISVNAIEEYGNAVLDAMLGKTENVESQKILEKIRDQIAEQMPSTFGEKERAFRYFAMLANPRTHMRNMTSNAVMSGVTLWKNVNAAITEQTLGRAVRKFSAQKNNNLDSVSKSFRGMSHKGKSYQFAKADAERMKSVIKGDATKAGVYSTISAKEIMKRRDIFSKHWWSKIYDNKLVNAWADGMAESDRQWISKTGRGLQKVTEKGILNVMSQGNTNLLESEDWFFSKRNYIRALNSYLNANKIDVDVISEEQLTKAREYAVSEALKSTFREDVAVVKALNQASKQSAVFDFVLSSILPFKKTPANIVRRAIEYSPYGFVKTISKGLYDVYKGRMTTAQWCDSLAQGFTGMEIMLIGIWGFSKGFLVGEDDEETKVKNDLFGIQNYSIKIGGYSFTIDWMSPAAMPLFIGYNVGKSLEDGEFETSDAIEFFGALMDVAPGIISPLVDMSMLKGLMGTLKSVSYAQDDSEILTNFLAEIPQQFVSQYMPSALRALAKTIDNTRRNTYYVDKNSKVPETLQRMWNTILASTPGLTYQLEPMIDTKGEVMKNAEGNVASRILQNFISPGYYKKIKSSVVDEELNRLYNELGAEDAKSIIPKGVSKKIVVGEGEEKETINLTAEQYTMYAQTVGKTYYAKAKDIITTDYYKNLSDDKKVEILEQAYKYALEIGREKTIPEYRITNGWLKLAMENESMWRYLIQKEEEGKFSPKDLDDKAYEAFEAERAKIASAIFEAYKPSGTFEQESKWYKDVYNYAEKLALEKHSDGKYAIEEKWMNQLKLKNPKEQGEFIFSRAENAGEVDDVSVEDTVKYNKTREEVMKRLYEQHTPDGSNKEYGKKYDDLVYKYADAVAKEQNSDGEYLIANDADKWVYQMSQLDEDLQDDYLRGKSIIDTSESEEKGKMRMIIDDNIDDEVKVYLTSDSAREQYIVQLKPHGVDAVTWLAVRSAKESFEPIKREFAADITVKEQTCDYINSLPISDEQKSALFRACGYEDVSKSMNGRPLKDVDWQYEWDGNTTRGILNQRVGTVISNADSGTDEFTRGGNFNNDAASGQCVWYVRGRAYEIAGASVPAIGNANEMWYSAKDSAKLSLDVSNLKKDTIVSYRKGTSSKGQIYGHVIYIEGVDGNTVYYTESKSGGYSAGTLKTATVDEILNGSRRFGTEPIGIIDVTKY